VTGKPTCHQTNASQVFMSDNKRQISAQNVSELLLHCLLRLVISSSYGIVIIT